MVTGDDFPEVSDICFAESQIGYQIPQISGGDSLIPSGFLLTSGTEHRVCSPRAGLLLGVPRIQRGIDARVRHRGRRQKLLRATPGREAEMGAGKFCISN